MNTTAAGAGHRQPWQKQYRTHVATAFDGAGLTAYARITGVVPRELGPEGTAPFRVLRGAHRGNTLVARSAAGYSAGDRAGKQRHRPELQAMAGRWLKPDITVLSNTLPDHQEAWGPSGASAAEVLVAGIPKGGKVVLPDTLENDTYLQELLHKRDCTTLFAGPAAGIDVPYWPATTVWRWLQSSNWVSRSNRPGRRCLACNRIAMISGYWIAMAQSWPWRFPPTISPAPGPCLLRYNGARRKPA